jgi:hypothetical protein
MFYALRDIAVGEELTVDYGTFREATTGLAGSLGCHRAPWPRGVSRVGVLKTAARVHNCY